MASTKIILEVLKTTKGSYHLAFHPNLNNPLILNSIVQQLSDEGHIKIPMDELKAIATVESFKAEDVPDELFFELLKINPDILKAPFALEKINIWREHLELNPRTSEKAKGLLLRVGSALAFEGWERDLKFDPAVIAKERDLIVKWLKENKFSRLGSEGNKRLLLKKALGYEQIVDSLTNLNKPPSQLGNDIVGAHRGLNPSYVNRIWSICRKLQVKNYDVYIVKTPLNDPNNSALRFKCSFHPFR